MTTKKSNLRRVDSASKIRLTGKLEEVTKENRTLKTVIECLEDENEKFKNKLQKISERLISNIDQRDYHLSTYKHLSEIPEDDLLSMISDIISKKERKEDCLESRIEEVETRITQISTEYAKLFQLKLQLENGLEDIENSFSLEVAQKQAKKLKKKSVNTQILMKPKEESIQKENKETENNKDLVIEECLNDLVDEEELMNKLPLSVRCNLETVHVPLQYGKRPGETPISQMIPELKQLVIQHLSLAKGNGSDWRMFAERIGLEQSLINQWQKMKLNQPMRNVLNVWSESPGATVRLLHRHLVSPQLKCIMLAKRIADCYLVD